MSLMAGLVFGGLSFYGAFNITYNSKDIKVSLCEYGSKTWFRFPFSSIMSWYLFTSSVCWTPLSHHGNKVQEIWKADACRNYVWAKVRVQLTQ